MDILECDDSWQAAWDDFISSTPGASFYHRYGWREINRASLGHESSYIAAVEGRRIVGILPIVNVRTRMFGNIACSMPFVNYGGPVGVVEGVENQLLGEAERIAARWNVEFLELRSRRSLGDRYPTALHKVSMTVQLPSNSDEMWNGFKSELRQHIRRGDKRGFKGVAGGPELVDDFFTVLCEAWRDMGTPIYGRDYMKRVAGAFSAKVRVCVVYHEGQPAAAAFQAYDNGIAEGLWLGTRARYRHDYVGYVLYWTLLKDAIEAGCHAFHLGRSNAQSGAEQFKKKWNAVPTQLYFQYILRSRTCVPQLNVMNPKYRLAIAAWRRLPLKVTNRIGPRLARGIP